MERKPQIIASLVPNHFWMFTNQYPKIKQRNQNLQTAPWAAKARRGRGGADLRWGHIHYGHHWGPEPWLEGERSHREGGEPGKENSQELCEWTQTQLDKLLIWERKFGDQHEMRAHLLWSMLWSMMTGRAHHPHISLVQKAWERLFFSLLTDKRPRYVPEGSRDAFFSLLTGKSWEPLISYQIDQFFCDDVATLVIELGLEL
jgi:hypothetical protein